MKDVAEIARELSLVDEELVQLHAEAARLRAQIGDRDAGPVDPAETAATITAAEEQEALIDVLERRREDLRSKMA